MRPLQEGMLMNGAVEFLIFLLATAGASSLTAAWAGDMAEVFPRISKWIYRKPWTCPLCMGFWYGMGIKWWVDGGKFPASHEILIHGLAGAAFSWILSSAASRMEEK